MKDKEERKEYTKSRKGKKGENKENKNKEQEKQDLKWNKQEETKGWWKRKQNQMKVNKRGKKVWRRKVEETMYHCWTSCRCSHPALQRALCWINQTRLWCFWAARYQGRETGAEPQVEAVRQPMTRSAYWSVVLPQQGRGNQVDIAFIHTLK